LTYSNQATPSAIATYWFWKPWQFSIWKPNKWFQLFLNFFLDILLTCNFFANYTNIIRVVLEKMFYLIQFLSYIKSNIYSTLDTLLRKIKKSFLHLMTNWLINFWFDIWWMILLNLFSLHIFTNLIRIRTIHDILIYNYQNQIHISILNTIISFMSTLYNELTNGYYHQHYQMTK
jgi:hypothetical protein